MITIICSGSRGDFQPYIALAKALQKKGQKVRITAGQGQKDFVEQHGIDVYPISIDVTNASIDPKLLEAAGSSDNPLKMLLTFNKMKDLGYDMLKESFNACKGSDLIIYHPGCPVGFFAAEELGIPSVLVSPFPIHKNDDYLSVVMYGKSKNTAFKRKLSYTLLYNMLWTISKQSLKKLWKETYGRLPNHFGCTFDYHITPSKPAIISCSNHIFPKPKTLSHHIHQSGYLFLDEDLDFKPDKTLEDFLAQGDKPVYIGFGNMLRDDEKQKYAAIAIEALQTVNKRGILYGFGDLKSLPDTIISIQSTPHSWLFSRMSAVCHHGGAGTSAEGFKAGVPSIIVPFSNDQFAWAYRAHDLGIGTTPIHKKDFSVPLLVNALNQIDEPKMLKQCQHIGYQIHQETALEDGVAIILDLLK